MAAKPPPTVTAAKPPANNSVELGTINYVNLKGAHGDINEALDECKKTGKPMFANFVEWPGWYGCREAGKIFADPAVSRAAEELFTPAAFNTYDRGRAPANEPHQRWALNLKGSWWGYLRIVSPDGKTVLSGTRQITGAGQRKEVIAVMREALEELEMEVPEYLK